MTPPMIERARDASLELSLHELAGSVPPDRAGEVARRHHTGATNEFADHRRRAQQIRPPAQWLGAAFLLLGAGVTTGIFALSSPAAIGGPIVAFVSGQHAYARSVQDGEARWKTKIPKGRYGRPVVTDEKVYLATDLGMLYSLRCADGQLAWQRQIGGHGYLLDGTRNFTIHGQRMVCAMKAPSRDGNRGRLAAVQLATGKLLWSIDTPRKICGHGIVDGRVFATVEDGSLLTANLADGKGRKSINTGIDSIRAPCADAQQIYVVGHQVAAAYSLDKLQLNWRLREDGPREENVQHLAPILIGGRVILAGHQLTAISATKGLLVWKSAGIGAATLVQASGRSILVADETPRGSRLSLYRARDGSAHWHRLPIEPHPTGLAIHAGTACLVSPGLIHAIRLADSKPLWKVEMEGHATSPPGVGGTPTEKPATAQPRDK